MFKAKPLIKRINYGMIALLLLAVQAIPIAAFWNNTASAASTGSSSGSSFSGNISAPSGDHDWSNASNASSSDNNRATVEITHQNNVSNYLRATDFGFSIPNDATINGITANIERSEGGDDSSEIQDEVVSLVKNNTVVGSNKAATGTDWPASDAIATYGNNSDMWGTTWTPGEINSANFGAVVSVARNGGSNDDETARVDHITISVDYTVATPPVQPLANPSLAQSCGLDVALVLDNSGSISSGELATMRDAMKSFTAAFTGTPTQFSVTRFATTASVEQAFTADIGDVNNAIDGIGTTSGGAQYTNWEDGLTKAQSTFDPRLTVPNMVIFASDGNPNTVGNGPGDNASPDGSVAAMNPAVTVANSLKTAQNAHILSLGIGNNLSTSNLEKVSGPGDVISSDFASLANDLAELAANLCGGTITTTKLIDHDNNPQTDPIKGQGWNFDVAGESEVTDINGQTSAVEVDPGNYSVTETVKPGYEIVDASCKDSTDAELGQFNPATKAVEGITVSNSSIVSCEFLNRPTTSTLIVEKVVVGGPSENSPEDFSFKVNDGNATAFEGDGSNEVTVNEGDYNVAETNIPAGYNPSYSDDCEGTITGGHTKTCTITNTYAPKPILDVVKYATNDNGGTILAKDFNLLLNGNSLGSPDSSVDSTPNSTANYDDIELTNGENYTVSETPVAGYENTSTTCYDITNGTDGASAISSQPFTAENGKKYLCKVKNDDITPKVIVKKIVKNMWGGNKTTSDFLLYLNGNQVTSGAENTVNIGDHTASEDNLPGYFGKFSGDCDPSGNISVQLLDKVYECVITNYDKPGILIIKKKVINDDGGDKKAKDFKFKVNYGYPISFTKYGVNAKFVPRGEYTVKEVYAPGYKTTYDGCKDIFIDNGEKKVCTITNDDIAPKLTLKKVIAPKERYGNHTPSDWTLTATPVWQKPNSNAPVIEGNGDPFSGSGVFYEKAVAGVVYKLSETGPAGYDEGAWTCYGKKGTYHIFHGDKLWLKPGAKVKCWVINTEQAPKLTVVKHIVNDDDGEAGIEDFGIKINDDALTFDDGVYNKATKTTTYTSSLNVYADQEYVLSEKDLEGYSEGDWVCTNEVTGTDLSVSLMLSLGDDVTCEIINDDIPPQPEQPEEEQPPVIPSVITLPKTSGMHPVLVALSLGALTAVVMSGSLLAKNIATRRQ